MLAFRILIGQGAKPDLGQFLCLFRNAFCDQAAVVPGGLPHVRDHLGDRVVVVVDDVDAGAFAVATVDFALALKHEVKVEGKIVTAANVLDVTVVVVIAF